VTNSWPQDGNSWPQDGISWPQDSNLWIVTDTVNANKELLFLSE